MLTAELISQRVKQVRRSFKSQGIDALLLTYPANVRYCTGFRSGDSWALIMPRSVIFMTDSRYTEQAEQECLGCTLLERRTTLADLVAGVCEKTPAIKTLGGRKQCHVAAVSRNQEGRQAQAQGGHGLCGTGPDPQGRL